MRVKSTFTAFVFLLIMAAKAQDLGKVVIRNASEAYPKFIVSLNGVRLLNDYAAVVTFDYLDETNYKVKILQAGATRPLVFTLSSAPKYTSRYMISRDNAGNYALVLESKMLTGSPADQQPVANPGNATSPPPIMAPQPMSDTDYESLQQAIKKESFENGKLDLAKTFFSNAGQYVSSVQVAGILKLFAFENNKLAFAKFVYDRTVDKQNYYKVSEALSFNSSKQELNDYINKKSK